MWWHVSFLIQMDPLCPIKCLGESSQNIIIRKSKLFLCASHIFQSLLLFSSFFSLFSRQVGKMKNFNVYYCTPFLKYTRGKQNMQILFFLAQRKNPKVWLSRKKEKESACAISVSNIHFGVVWLQGSGRK